MQTSFCGEVGFEIWLKHHGKVWNITRVVSWTKCFTMQCEFKLLVSHSQIRNCEALHWGRIIQPNIFLALKRCRLKFSSLSSPGNSIFPITTFFCVSLWDFVTVLIGLPSVDLWWQYQFTSSSRYSPHHCYHWIISSGYEQIRNINGALDHEIPYYKMQYHAIPYHIGQFDETYRRHFLIIINFEDNLALNAQTELSQTAQMPLM